MSFDGHNAPGPVRSCWYLGVASSTSPLPYCDLSWQLHHVSKTSPYPPYLYSSNSKTRCLLARKRLARFSTDAGKFGSHSVRTRMWLTTFRAELTKEYQPRCIWEQGRINCGGWGHRTNSGSRDHDGFTPHSHTDEVLQLQDFIRVGSFPHNTACRLKDRGQYYAAVAGMIGCNELCRCDLSH